jgi:hypothetical protein
MFPGHEEQEAEPKLLRLLQDFQSLMSRDEQQLPESSVATMR